MAEKDGLIKVRKEMSRSDEKSIIADVVVVVNWKWLRTTE